MIDALRITSPAHRRPLVGLLRSWLETQRSRQQLARLDTRMLDDIGITPGDAAREAGRPFWDVPRGR